MCLNKAITASAVVLAATAPFAAISLTGTVTDATSGAKLKNVAVVLMGQNLFDSTDAAGVYKIVTGSPTALPVINGMVRLSPAVLQLRDRSLVFDLAAAMPVRIDAYAMSGRLAAQPVNAVLPAGPRRIQLDDRLFSSGIFIIRASFGAQQYIYKLMCSERAAHLAFLDRCGGRKAGSVLAKGAAAGIDTLVACKAGYLCKKVPISTYTGVYDIQLDPLDAANSASAWEDGSAIRIARYGEAQVFWGDPGTGKDIPLVKIIHAESADAVDVVVIFNPKFVDNTYGTGSVGWSPRRGHTFNDLVGSDHVEIRITNGNGETVFFGKIDLLSADPTAPSGYASKGPFGGDGKLVEGDASNIISFGSSLDDNLNYYGYKLTQNSPATDSVYTTNPDYPYWEYYCIYRLTIDPAAFGPSGYGSVAMTYVHASPAKVSETITVTEGPVPVPGSPEDVFQYRKTYTDTPPTDGSSNRPPGGGTTPPPDDGSSTVPPGEGPDAGPPSDQTTVDNTVPPPDDGSTILPPGAGGTAPSDDGAGAPGGKPPEDGSDAGGSPPPADETDVNPTVPPPDDGGSILPPG